MRRPMLRPRWWKVLRDLWVHRGRTLVVVLAIVVGLAGAGAVLDAWALLRLATREGYLVTNPASATLRVDSVDAALLRAIRALPAVRDAEARRTVVAGIRLDGSWGTALLYSSDVLAETRIGALAREQGQWPPADGAFVIERSSVDFSDIGVGDTILVRAGEGTPVRLPVTGVVRDAGLAPGWMEHVVYGFVTPATLASLGAPSSLDQIQIVVRDRALTRDGVQAVAREVREVATGLGHAVRAVDVPVPGRHIHAAQMDSLLMTMGAFGLLALFMSGFLVVNLITGLLAGQVREIGVMKAVGARPSQLAAMYLGSALALGIIASAVAIPLAALVGREYARFAAGLLNFTIDGYRIPGAALLVQLVAGMLLPVLAALVPVVRGSRIPVAAALRDAGIGGGGRTPPWLDRVRGVRRPLLLSLRNAFRRRQRMALTLLTLAVGGAAFLAALDLRAAIRGAVGHLYGDLLRFDVTIRLDAPHAADSLEMVASRIAGVARAEAWSGARASLAGDEELEGPFSVTALPADSRLVALPVVAGRWLHESDSTGIVVSTALLAAQPALAVGRVVDIQISGRRARWTVIGSVSAGPGRMAYATRGALARVTGDARATTVVIRAADREAIEGDGAALIARVRGRLEESGLAVSSSQLMGANRRVIEDHLLMVAAFLLVMAQLTIVVGGLGLGSTMSLAVLERTREIGVLRAIGAAPGAIMLLVQVEGLVVALLSWWIAIPLSLPVSALLARAFGRIMFPVPVRLLPEWTAVAAWLGVALVVSAAASAWPAFRATRIPTAAALAYE